MRTGIALARIIAFLLPLAAPAQAVDTIRLELQRDTLCIDLPELTARETGIAYRWDTGDTSRTISVANGGFYTAFILLADSSIVIDPREVILVSVPAPVLPIPDLPPPYCEGQSITYSVSLMGYDSIEWNDGRGNVTPGFGPNNSRATFTFRVGGGVSYIAYYGRCRETLTVLPPLPFLASDLGENFVASLTGDPAGVCAGDSVTLRVTGRQIDRIAWADGSVDSVRTVVAELDAEPTVTVFSACGDTATVLTAELTVADCDTATCELVLPDLITPNGDGRNDRFRPFTDCELGGYSLTIFNRWGQRVAELSEADGGWDGLHGGTAQEADAYLYVLVYRISGEAQQRSERGSFHLLR